MRLFDILFPMFFLYSVWSSHIRTLLYKYTPPALKCYDTPFGGRGGGKLSSPIPVLATPVQSRWPFMKPFLSGLIQTLDSCFPRMRKHAFEQVLLVPGCAFIYI